jgi:hypothetical protein
MKKLVALGLIPPFYQPPLLHKVLVTGFVIIVFARVFVPVN